MSSHIINQTNLVTLINAAKNLTTEEVKSIWKNPQDYILESKADRGYEHNAAIAFKNMKLSEEQLNNFISLIKDGKGTEEIDDIAQIVGIDIVGGMDLKSLGINISPRNGNDKIGRG